jgi:LPXTG-motif cell wall-anchored protein
MKKHILIASTTATLAALLLYPGAAMADPTIAHNNSINSCSYSPSTVTVNQGDSSPNHTQTLTGTAATIDSQPNMVYYSAYLYVDGVLAYGADDWWDEMASVTRNIFGWTADKAGETHVWKYYATSQDLTQLNSTVLCTLTASFGPTVPPVISGQASPVVKPGDTSVATFTASQTPANAQSNIVWTISGGADQSLFSLGTDGALTFLSPAADGTYTVVISATDQFSNVANQTVTVTVSDTPPSSASNLPETGFSTLSFGTVSGALIVIGAGLVFLRRRRRARIGTLG